MCVPPAQPLLPIPCLRRIPQPPCTCAPPIIVRMSEACPGQSTSVNCTRPYPTAAMCGGAGTCTQGSHGGGSEAGTHALSRITPPLPRLAGVTAHCLHCTAAPSARRPPQPAKITKPSTNREGREAQVQCDASLLALWVLVQRRGGKRGGQRRHCVGEESMGREVEVCRPSDGRLAATAAVAAAAAAEQQSRTQGGLAGVYMSQDSHVDVVEVARHVWPAQWGAPRRGLRRSLDTQLQRRLSAARDGEMADDL